MTKLSIFLNNLLKRLTNFGFNQMMYSSSEVKIALLCSVFVVSFDIVSNGQSYQTIGSGTESNGSSDYPAPFGNYYYGVRHQFLVTASELDAAGVPSGAEIVSIGFNITNTNSASTHDNYQVKLYTTSASNPLSSDWHSGTAAATSSSSNQAMATGWIQTSFTGFTWNGTDNIVIETCFQNSSDYRNASTQWSTGLSGATFSRWYRADASYVCGNSSTTSTSTSTRPNIRFGYNEPSACNATPTPGNTLAATNPVCPGKTTVLSLQNSTSGSGVSYQWQSSANNSTWSNISGATNSTYTATITSDVYFRCNVTCENEGNANSNSLLVELAEIAASCFCTPTYSNGGSTDNITKVVLENLDDTPPANNSPYYFNRTSNQNAVPILEPDESYTVSVTLGSDGAQYSGVWIDFNQNSTFDSGEFFSLGTSAGSNGTAAIEITVPSDAVSGKTIMRIRGGDDSQITSGHACGASSSGYGQALDYFVEIESPFDMYFVSATAAQPNTSDVSIGQTNQEVIRISIVTKGSLNPISLTELKLRIDGTSDVDDIQNARIWYTGNDNQFSLSGTQFGNSVAMPPTAGNDMTFTGNTSLVSGTNYFWLTYNIPAAATANNYIDAKLQSAIVDDTLRTPTISEPAGNRKLVKGCYHTITLRDDLGAWTGGATVTVKVGGVTRLNAITLSSGTSANHQFLADTDEEITVEYSEGTNSTRNSYYVTNPNGAYILSSGEHGTTPASSKSSITNCNRVKEFSVNNNTYQYNDTCFVITEDRTSQKGSVWSNYKLDMTSSFSLSFDLHLGTKSGGAGADGIVFVLQGDCTSAGSDGSGLGYTGITNSIAVEFDSYQNAGEPNHNHAAILSNGEVSHYGSENLDGPETLTGLVGSWHEVEILWNASTGKFSVNFNNTEILAYTNLDLVDDVLGGSPFVFYGFTGATGGLSNLHRVCLHSFPQNTTMLRDTLINPGDSVQVEVATGASSYLWTPNDGSISNANIANPILKPDVSTEYTCRIEDACGNIVYNRFWVNIYSNLFVDLLDFSSICSSESIMLSWSTASEINNDYFIIEGSKDAEIFFEIAKVNGAGNSSITQNYSVNIDRIEDVKYFRIKQVGFDGEIIAFNPIFSNCKNLINDDVVQVYPNPVKNILNIKLLTKLESNLMCSIIDVYGRVVYAEKTLVLTNDSMFSIDVSGFSRGTYILKLKSNMWSENIIFIKY